jgi:hypothetical protein
MVNSHAFRFVPGAKRFLARNASDKSPAPDLPRPLERAVNRRAVRYKPSMHAKASASNVAALRESVKDGLDPCA